MITRLVCGFALLTIGFVIPVQADEKSPMINPAYRGKLNPSIAASMRGKLFNADLKKQFVARELKLNPAVLGISEPVILNVSQAQLNIPGRVNITVQGDVHIDTAQNKFEIGRNGSVYVKFKPGTMQRASIYLVSATIDPGRGGKMSTRHNWVTRYKTGLLTLDANPQTLNFVVEPNGTQEAFLQLFADMSWNFAQVEITPVSR